MEIQQRLISHNYSKGRAGKNIIQITPHTAVSNAESLYHYFNNPDTKASTHYYVNKAGVIERYVLEENTAHSNANLNANRQSITFETWDGGNPADSKRTKELYESSAELVALLSNKYGIPLVLLTKEQALNNKPGITLHKYYAARSCPGGLDIQKIINRAKELLKYPATVTTKARAVALYSDPDRNSRVQFWFGSPVELLVQGAQFGDFFPVKFWNTPKYTSSDLKPEQKIKDEGWVHVNDIMPFKI